jgi:hypothetical protein
MLSLTVCILSELSCYTMPDDSPTTTPDLSPSSSVGTDTSSANSAPSMPIEFIAAFPNGAPMLNQMAELRVAVQVRANIPAKDISIRVNLPEGVELLNGNLSWTGDVPIKSNETVIIAQVKAVKIGNWTIDVRGIIDPKKNGGFGGDNINASIYLLVTEKSAEWRKYPAYPPLGSTPLPVGQVPATINTDPSPKVDLTFKTIPLLNKPAEIICTLSTSVDMPNLTVHLLLPLGAEIVDGNAEWIGNLKAGVPTTFSKQILFRQPGRNGIGWHVSQAGRTTGWANTEVICLIIDETQSYPCLNPTPIPPPR